MNLYRIELLFIILLCWWCKGLSFVLLYGYVGDEMAFESYYIVVMLGSENSPDANAKITKPRRYGVEWKILSPFLTQQDRRHETMTNRKSVKNWYIEYIGGIPTALF